ncbi:MAG: hypothetical protein LBR07_09770 [Puniceicoccales bacterium]|nr:hypothetical protein [Puniceicoccales bacterium]
MNPVRNRFGSGLSDCGNGLMRRSNSAPLPPASAEKDATAGGTGGEVVTGSGGAGGYRPPSATRSKSSS